MTRTTKNKRVTIKDVALRAEVALGTVSRIINGNQTVAPELRKHVETVIKELGYRPNATARTLRTNKTNVVGIIVTDLRQPVASQLVAAAADIVRSHSFAPVVGDFRDDADNEAMLLRFMSERNVDGLLLTISSDENPGLITSLKKLDFPIVLWERDAAGQFPSIRSDHRLGTRLAAGHLQERGRKRVLLVAGHERTWTGREQVAGMQEGLGKDVSLTVVHTGHFVPRALEENLAGADAYDAVVANIHDIPAIMQVVNASGRRCPRDISIVSIGDDPFLEIASPAISAVRLRPDLVGAIAARLLIAQLDKKAERTPQDAKLVPPELRLRASS